MHLVADDPILPPDATNEATKSNILPDPTLFSTI